MVSLHPHESVARTVLGVESLMARLPVTSYERVIQSPQCHPARSLVMLGGKHMGRKRIDRTLHIIHPNAAGIDVGKSKHYVAVDPRWGDDSVRSFEAFTDDMHALAEWLRQCEVEVVAMEATGVYWIPLFEVLDRAGFEVHLVNPRATKQVSGRKSDVLDCQWIWQLMSYGLLKGAFRPPDEICELRSFVRQRGRLTKDSARVTQQMQKALTEMNVQLDNVLSDITGKTGMAILRAIIAGERDGEQLARFRDRRVKADEATIARSLRGNWRAEHLFALAQALERYNLFQAQIAACDGHIAEQLEVLGSTIDDDNPTYNGRTRKERVLQQSLHATLGVDLTAIPTIGIETALVIAAEIGPDLSRFPSQQHFCSWLNLAPGTRISGDKRIGGPPVSRSNRAGQALRMAAANARHSQSFIGAAHRARLQRLDTGRAVKATAHQLARLIYAMLTRGEDYVERGISEFEERRRHKQIRNLKRQAAQLGATVTFKDP